jgi:mRNA interferase MazF
MLLAEKIQQSENLSWQSWKPKRGEIYLVDLGNDSIDCEQKGLRPALILSNNIGNTMGSIVTIAPVTTRNKGIPKIHVPVGQESGVRFDSYILTEHIRSISKRRFWSRGTPMLLGKVTERKIIDVENAIRVELGFLS